MRIGIDGRMWNESGIGRYVRGLVRGLSEIDKDSEYYLIVGKDLILGMRLEANFSLVRVDFGWYGVVEQIKMPKVLDKLKLDLVHFPHFNVPVFYGGRYVVTIHDLLHEKYAMRRSSTLDPVSYRLKKVGYRKVFGSAVRKAGKIIVPSQFVKNDLHKYWKVENEKVVVTQEGVDDDFVSLAGKVKKSDIGSVLRKFGIQGRYLFYVGNAHPHKNIEGLAKAYKQLKNQYPDLELVLAGRENFFWKRVLGEISSIEGVKYLGYVSDEELVCLLKGAQGLVEPSFEEGFGLPLLEAFVCECPVVSSNGGSLPEVGGDAAVYFDANSTHGMMKAIGEALSDKKLRAHLKKEGLERLKMFSWEKMAGETLQLYKSV